MSSFDPRSKNRRYLSRDTSGQLEFTSSDATDTFAHHMCGFNYMATDEGRVDQGSISGRNNSSWRVCYRDDEGIRKFDQPDDYYRDPRDPQ